MAVLRYFHQDPKATAVQESQVTDTRGTTLTTKLTNMNTSITNNTQAIDDKQNIIPGKSLSTNDFSDYYRIKLNGIEDGAEVNVLSDWDENDDTADSYIKNKPESLPASDVPDWAKQPNKPSYTLDEVVDGNSRKLSDYIPVSQKGVYGGVATLGANDGKVPESLLPSYVDDVLEYTSNSQFPVVGESGKIYVNTTTNLTYRWTGTQYTEISPSIALGETSSTAYAGDKGKRLADAIDSISNTITDTSDYSNTLDWGTAIAIARVNGIEITAKLPANPNTWRPISDSVNTTSSTTSASLTAVKAAYDLAASKTSNTGTVTSVGVSVPTGLSVSNTPITTSGTIAIALANGYSIPTTAKLSNWDTAYGWGNHASAGYVKTNTTYTIATGDSNGLIKVTPSSGNAYNVSVKGLGSAAYLNADTAASASTVVQRDANKYIYGTYFNSNIGDENINSYTSNPAIMFTSNDKWIRRTTKANLLTWLGLGSRAYDSTAYLPLTGGTMTGVVDWGAGSTREILQFSTHNDYKSGLRYCWSSNTTISLWGKHRYTAFVWHAGNDGDINGHGSDVYDFKIKREDNIVTARLAGNIMWHAGNDGSNSGLDADTLDGIHDVSYFRFRQDEIKSNINADNLTVVGVLLNLTGNGSNNSNFPETYSNFFNFRDYYGTQFSIRSNFYWRTLRSNSAGTAWRKIWDSYNLTNLNQLTNGPGYITGITKTMVTNALGYTPPTSDTNNAVTLTNTTANAMYRVLFSATADDANRTEGARKSTNLMYNPSERMLSVYGTIAENRFDDTWTDGYGKTHPWYGWDGRGNSGLNGCHSVYSDYFGMSFKTCHLRVTVGDYAGTVYPGAGGSNTVSIKHTTYDSSAVLYVDGSVKAGTINSTSGVLNIQNDSESDVRICCYQNADDNTRGYVGIGKASPSYKLHVNGLCGATGFPNTSDIRLKDILSDCSIKLEDIANAPLFLFEWNDRDENKTHVGTSAQYWEEVIPDIVSEADDDIGTKSLEYGVLGVASSISIAKEVVELKKEIKLLQALIAELKLLLNK